MKIRNQIASSSAQASTAAMRQQLLNQRKSNRGFKKATPAVTRIAAYAGVFAVVISLVAVGYRTPQDGASVASLAQLPSSSVVEPSYASVDELLATSIAADLAETANLPVAKKVSEISVSLAAKSMFSQTDDTSLSKPQIVQPTASNRDLTTYTAKAGDTVDSIAERFGISKDTLKWANNLTSDAVERDRKLVILPVDGIRYTIKDGDSVEEIAAKYRADKSRIIAFNDLELGGLTKDKQIIIPGGVLPQAERPGYVAPAAPAPVSYTTGGAPYTRVNNAFANASAGNAYAFGNCTWYAYERRAQLGRPIGSFWGNAATWAMYARAAGFTVNNTPAPGAIMQNGGGYGHVAIVESVAPNGDITITEMNYAGNFNRVTSRTVSAGQAAYFNYIH